MFLIGKYGTQTTFTFPMVKRGVVDLAVSADWTPAAADSAISKDQGSFADTTNTVAAVGGSPTRTATGWKLTLTATEMQAATIDLQIIDAATKAVEDQYIKIYTYGHASAKIQADLSDVVRLGLTALPNAAAEASGGLFTRGSGAGQINQPANGMVDSNVVRNAGTAITAASGVQEVKVQSIAANAIADAAVAEDMDSYTAKIWVIKESTTTDHYVVRWFKNGVPITSGITSPTIQVIKASDGTDLIASTALTEIGSTHRFKRDESTNKMSGGQAYFAVVSGTIDGPTRTYEQQVGRDSA